MATRRERLRFCDNCGSDKDVEPRSIVVPPTLRFDACAKCRNSVPLSVWEKKIPPRSNVRLRRHVYTEEELDQLTKKNRRTARKR